MNVGSKEDEAEAVRPRCPPSDDEAEADAPEGVPGRVGLAEAEGEGGPGSGASDGGS